MRIALVCLHGAINMASWRGNADALESHLAQLGHEVERIDIRDEFRPFFFKPKQLFHRIALRQPYTRHREPAILRFVGRILSERIQKIRPDVVLSLTAMPVPYLECAAPIVIWNDAPFDALLNFYDNFTGLSKASIADGRAMETLAHERAAFAVYTSPWGADAALAYTSRDKLRIVPLGANLPLADGDGAVDRFARAASIELLWIGMEWKRKGGDIAVFVVERLNKRGRNARLTVAGTKPLDFPSTPESLNYVGFVPASAKRGLFDFADFLILPSRADCSPLVIAEAYALGTPVVTSRAGGIPAMVDDDLTGHTFESDDVEGYVRFIESTIADRSRYEKLSAMARKRYLETLNWETSSTGIVRVLEEAIRATKS